MNDCVSRLHGTVHVISSSSQGQFYRRISAPEIVAGHSYAPAADVFSYGLVLAELLFPKRNWSSDRKCGCCMWALWWCVLMALT
jgi:hypothetical protein